MHNQAEGLLWCCKNLTRKRLITWLMTIFLTVWPSFQWPSSCPSTARISGLLHPCFLFCESICKKKKNIGGFFLIIPKNIQHNIYPAGSQGSLQLQNFSETKTVMGPWAWLLIRWMCHRSQVARVVALQTCWGVSSLRGECQTAQCVCSWRSHRSTRCCGMNAWNLETENRSTRVGTEKLYLGNGTLLLTYQ